MLASQKWGSAFSLLFGGQATEGGIWKPSEEPWLHCVGSCCSCLLLGTTWGVYTFSAHHCFFWTVPNNSAVQYKGEGRIWTCQGCPLLSGIDSAWWWRGTHEPCVLPKNCKTQLYIRAQDLKLQRQSLDCKPNYPPGGSSTSGFIFSITLEKQ